MVQIGHLYQYGHHTQVIVTAWEDPHRVRVRVVDHAEPLGAGRAHSVDPRWLTPLPMKYFGGQVPR